VQAIAKTGWRLGSERTTVPLRWLAEQLAMGSAMNVSRLTARGTSHRCKNILLTRMALR